MMGLSGQGNIFLSQSMKSLRKGIVNSSEFISGKAEFCVLAKKLRTKEKVQVVQPLECLTLYDRLYK